jgi:deoxyadenosine/deoxycytidine kinase
MSANIVYIVPFTFLCIIIGSTGWIGWILMKLFPSEKPFRRKRWFTVESPIGGGKSTFLRMIAEKVKEKNMNIRVIQEPVDQWISVGILDAFYKNPKENAYKFQTFTFLSRLRDIMEAQKSDAEVIIVERSFFSDKYVFAQKLYDDLLINKMEWDMYNQWWDYMSQDCCERIGKPTGYIYLRASPEIAFERMNKRARNEESTVSIEYIRENVRAHEEWLIEDKWIQSDDTTPVLVLNANKDFENNKENFEQYIDNLFHFINTH